MKKLAISVLTMVLLNLLLKVPGFLLSGAGWWNL